MEKENILLLIIFSLLTLTIGAPDCSPASCGPNEPKVRFPFRIIGRQPDQCGFPGFDLSCDEQNKTIIRFPSSLSYIVNTISYDTQAIYLDPGFCQPNRIVSLELTDPPFSFSGFGSYTFLNCSSQNSSFTYPYVPYPCLSSENYTVIGALIDFSMLSNCKVMKTIMVPVDQINTDLMDTLELSWYTPYCKDCEKEGKTCRLKSDGYIGETVCISSSHGIRISVRYGLSIGIGVSALIICIVGLTRHASSSIQGHNDSHNQGIHLSSVTIIPQPASGSRTGLDGPTIESYPKTVLKKGCRLPNDERTVLKKGCRLPNDERTCSICLCEYKPKELLRTIPECNHYFHVECIDEWLKLNGTCPVCRNKP